MTRTQLFSSQFCEISKNTFSKGTPLVAASTIHTTIVEYLNKWNAPIDLKIESLPWYRFLQSICFCAFLSIFCTAFTVLSFNILSLTYSFYHHSLTRIVFPLYIIIHKTISYIKALSKSSSGLSLLQLPLREKVRISLILYEYGKIGTKKVSVFGHFHTVYFSGFQSHLILRVIYL